MPVLIFRRRLSWLIFLCGFFSLDIYAASSLLRIQQGAGVTSRERRITNSEDAHTTVDITPEMLAEFVRTDAPNLSSGLQVLMHPVTKEIWILIEATKEVWVFPLASRSSSWIKWPKLRNAAQWITSDEPAAWFDAGTITAIGVATFLWAQPWTDPTPKYSTQTVCGMISALALIPLALIPKTILCADRHLNKQPKPIVRRYNMRESAAAVSTVRENLEISIETIL